MKKKPLKGIAIIAGLVVAAIAVQTAQPKTQEVAKKSNEESYTAHNRNEAYVKSIMERNSDTPTPTATPTPVAGTTNPISDETKISYQVLAEDLGDKYVNVKYPFLTSDWTIGNWDNDGSVFALTTVSVTGQISKYDFLAIFTPSGDGYSYTAHYLYVGNAVYYNDNTYNDTLQKNGLPVA